MFIASNYQASPCGGRLLVQESVRMDVTDNAMSTFEFSHCFKEESMNAAKS
jgi:hypothetical protein